MTGFCGFGGSWTVISFIGDKIFSFSLELRLNLL